MARLVTLTPADSAPWRVGVSASLRHPHLDGILLVFRTDCDCWGVPGGGVDLGESLEEACVREVFEETGFSSHVTGLVGVYHDPTAGVMYPDGNVFRVIAIHFSAEIVGGAFHASEEARDYRFVTRTTLHELSLFPFHAQRVRDSLTQGSNRL